MISKNYKHDIEMSMVEKQRNNDNIEYGEVGEALMKAVQSQNDISTFKEMV
jgi:hypothetical protein